MNSLLADIEAKLAANQPSVSCNSISRLTRSFAGWKLMLDKEVILEGLDEIERMTKFLHQTVTESARLEPSRRKKRAKGASDAIKAVQKQATSLYNAFFWGNYWNCLCRRHHVASLRLDKCGHCNLNTAPMFNLRVTLSEGILEGCRRKGTVWRDLEVEIQDTSGSDRHTQTESLPIGRSVRFAPAYPSSTVTAKASTQSSNPTDSQPVSDLCTSMSQSPKSKTGIGYLVDMTNAFNSTYKYILSISRPDNGTEIETTTLASLLKDRATIQTRLSRADRLHIAANLATSVLQLETTPWLKPGWTSSDISFHDVIPRAGIPQRSSLAIDPYLSWRLEHAHKKSEISAGERSLLLSYGVRNVGLLSIAFVLIELSLGKTLEEMATEEDHDPNAMISRRKTAIRVHEDVYYESGIHYG